MLYLGIIIKFILWHIVSVASSVSYTDQWSDWIIIPARSGTSRQSLDISKNSSDFDVVQRNNVNSYFDSEQMKTFIMRTVKLKDNWKHPEIVKSESNHFESNNHLTMPFARAIETVKAFCGTVMDFLEQNSSYNDDREPEPISSRKLKKLKKKYKRFLFPLLLAYKLKFLALIPVLMGGLVLLVGTTGLAGFFFALFTAVMSLKSENKVDVKKW